jgi:hypothetical protein
MKFALQIQRYRCVAMMVFRGNILLVAGFLMTACYGNSYHLGEKAKDTVSPQSQSSQEFSVSAKPAAPIVKKQLVSGHYSILVRVENIVTKQ